jgi:hydrogenase maturation protein HypF
MELQGRRIEVLGTVQGVGFRPWIYRIARALGIKGQVHNDGRGVTSDAFGNQEVLDGFLQAIEANPPPAAAIRRLSWTAIPARECRGTRTGRSERCARPRAARPFRPTTPLPLCGEAKRESVYALCARGKLPHVRVSNALRIAPEDIESFTGLRRN